MATKRNTRDLGIGGQNGKGDADRSPGWREEYDTIAWPDGAKNGVKKFKKVYGPQAPKADDQGPHIKVL